MKAVVFREQHVVARCEVAEERARRDPGGGGDLVDGHVVVTALDEQADRGASDLGAGVVAPPILHRLSSGGCWGNRPKVRSRRGRRPNPCSRRRHGPGRRPLGGRGFG